MPVEENKVPMRRFFEEHDRQKGPAPEFCTRNIQAIFFGRSSMSPEADRQMSGVFYSAFPDFRHILHHIVAEGDKVGRRITITRAHKQGLMGIAPAGRQVGLSAMGIARIDNGKVAEMWSIFDEMGLIQQPDAIPP